MERDRRVQHDGEMGRGEMGGADQRHRSVLRAGAGPCRQEGLQRQVERGHVVVLGRAHVLPVHIHHERLRQRGAQDHVGQGRHRRVRRVWHTAVRPLLPEHGKGTFIIPYFIIDANKYDEFYYNIICYVFPCV